MSQLEYFPEPGPPRYFGHDGVIVSFNYQENRKAALPDVWRQYIEALEATVNKPGQGEAVFLTFCSRVV